MEQSFIGNGQNSSEQRNSERQKLELDTRNLKFFKEDIFHLPFKELEDSSNYRHLKHVFVDEDDYEDFKQDLVDFHCMRSQWKNDRRKLSRDRNRINSCSSEQLLELPPEDQKSNVCESPVNLSPKLASKQVKSPSLDVSKSWLDLDPESKPIMDFFQNDEHFQEFDRVFETFKTKKRYASNSSLDKYRWSPHPDSDHDNGHDGSDHESGGVEDEEDVFGIKINDIFSDFFDNDDAFKHFEEEFEKFQFKRHSRALNSLHRNSVCDLIQDLKAFCDTEETNGSKTGSALQVESTLSLPKLWNKGGEWDYIFTKIRQHGKVTSENSDTGKSDLTVRYDSDSGDVLLDDLSECSEPNRDTGYYSEVKFDPESCTCPCASKHDSDCQFTCHHNCLPLIQLECKLTSHDLPEDEGAVFTGETSLSDLSSQHLTPSELSSEPATEKDETDSGYRSGTIPDEKLPHKPSDATLNREEIKRRIAEFNRAMPGANFALKKDETIKEDDAFQGFIKVTLNLVRPISMSIGARPPSIYEVLTREHIIEQNTQNISFYMPRDTIRSIHATSTQNTKEVVASLLKKFHILDHPSKFALYEQELKNNKIAKLRRVKDHEYPLAVCLSWDLESEGHPRLVLQENETGEIDWHAFCTPELNNFMKVLNREEDECVEQLKYKYKVMRRIIRTRMKELRQEAERQKRASLVLQEGASLESTS